MADIEKVRAELNRLVDLAGGNSEALKILKSICLGFTGGSKTLKSYRKGPNTSNQMVMITVLLRLALEKKIAIIDSEGDTPYAVHTVSIEPCDPF